MLSIIIPTYNRQKILQKSLEALHAARPEDSEVIIVNDSDTPLLLPSDDSMKIVANTTKGAASARNYGASIAKGDVLLFLDDDIVLTTSAIRHLLEKVSNSSKQLWFPNWRYPDTLLEEMDQSPFGRFLYQIRYHELKGWLQPGQWKSDENPFPLPGLASYCLMIKKSDFDEVGGYDQTFLFAGAEDHDMSERLKNKGFSFWLDPAVWVYHNESDRLQLKNWMHRRRTGAYTHRHALEKGYQVMKIDYSSPKKLVLKTVFISQPLIRNIAAALGSRKTQQAYNFLMKMLIAANIFQGYHIDYGKKDDSKR